MNTIEAFDLIEAVKGALKQMLAYDDDKKTREFLTALHERGLTISGKPKSEETIREELMASLKRRVGSAQTAPILDEANLWQNAPAIAKPSDAT